MQPVQNAFIDIVALDAIRGRFAAGEALAVLSPGLDRVIWANGAGAVLFGFADAGAITGAEPQIGLAAKRQIMATSGYPRIGKDRAITVRLASGLMSRAVAFAASQIELPGGEPAILLAHALPAASWRSHAEIAGRAIAGLDLPRRHVAIVDAEGRPLAASRDFAALDVKPETLAALPARAGGERLARMTVETGHGVRAAAVLRLTDEAPTFLVELIDEALPEAEDDGAVAPLAAAEVAAGLEEPDQDLPEDSAAAERDRPVDAEEPTAEVPPVQPDETAGPAPETIVGTQEPEAPVAADESAEDRPPEGAGSADAPRDEDEVVAQEQQLAAAGEAERESFEIAVADVADVEEQGEQEQAAGEADAEHAAQEAAPAEATIAEETAAADIATAEAAAALPHIEIDRSAAAVTFVWKTDTSGRFSEIGHDFVRTVGKPAGDVIGLSFREAAARLGIDPTGEIAGLLERRDTWSGRSVFWPVAGTDLRIPVDLAALPTYDRDRKFGGFRGFGVARAADAVVDPEATGLALVTNAAVAADTEPAAASQPTDPFQGEPPILTIVPKPERRQADKVIRLAEHRQPTIDKNLSPGERNAFREIGDRLRKESGAPVAKAPSETGVSDKSAGEPGRHADNDVARPASSRGDAGKDADGEEPRPAGLLDADQEHAATQAETKDTDAARPDAGEMIAEVPADEPAPEAPQPTETQHQAADDDGDAEHETGPAEQPQAVAENQVPDEATAPEALAPAVEQDEVARQAAADAAEADAASSTTADDTTEAPAAVIADAMPESEPASKPEPAAAEVQPAWRDHIPSAFAVGPGKRAAVDTSILDRLPVPVLIHAGDTLHYANREFFELTGYDSVAELDAAGGLDVLFGEPYPASEGETEAGRKLRLRTSEGLEYPVEAFLQSVPWGEGKSLLLSLRRSWRHPVTYPAGATPAPPVEPDADVEARIEEMRAIVDTATDGVVLIAPDGTIRSISSPAEALFGFDSEEIAGKPFSALFAIESQRAARDYLNGLSENGVASVLNDGREVIGREAQGRFIPLFMTIGKLPADSGFCAVLRDITQWKRAEEELTQARAQAERTSSQKTDFLARVSHEIRTPLNAIIGFSELMLDEKFGPVGNDRYRDYLRDINRSGNHVLDLVNDLLDISKIEAGQQEMSYEAVSLNDTLAETVAMMQPSANRERVIIRSSFASRLPEVVADLRSVRQIALNLLSNAIRYTPAGGQVIVSTAYEASGDVVMRVRDTGIGMAQAEIEQALKPFKQINALKRARGDGTGLGLPLTKAMVEANRARFMINSTPGEGTLVEISFPSTRVLAD